MDVRFISTGGTIDKVYFDRQSEFQIGEPQIVEALREANVTLEYRLTCLMRKDSLDMNDDDRERIRAAVADEPCRRVVVTHGTDTMAETGRTLAKIANKTIVLTGAMQPAGFRGSDALFNIGCAVVAVQTLPSGVYLAMNGRIFDPRRVRKNRERKCFEEII